MSYEIAIIIIVVFTFFAFWVILVGSQSPYNRKASVKKSKRQSSGTPSSYYTYKPSYDLISYLKYRDIRKNIFLLIFITSLILVGLFWLKYNL